MKKIAAALLAALMLLLLCSCSGGKQTVLTVSGAEIDSEIFTYYLDKVIQRPTDYGLTNNPQKDELRQAAVNECGKYLYANTEFRNRGLSLSAAEKVEISERVNDLWVRFENHYEDIKVSKQTLTKIQTSQAYGDAIFTSVYDKGAGDAAAEKELQDYFYSNYVCFRTVCAYFTSADGSSPMTQLEKNELLASFDALKNNNDKEAGAFAETVQAAGYTLSDSVLLKKGAEGYPAGFFEKVYSQATDTVQIIVYDECVFAVFKEDLKAKGESVYVNYRSSCISDLYSEQASREIEEYIASLQVEEKSGRIDRIIKRLK